jgi:hypothetical protein
MKRKKLLHETNTISENTFHATFENDSKLET